MMYTGDLYDRTLHMSDIAARLRKELKPIVHPHKFTVRVPHASALDITIKGVGLVQDDYKLTAAGELVAAAAKTYANRFNYDHNPDNYFGDSDPPNFYLDVEVVNAYSKADIENEVARLMEIYTIRDEPTLAETIRNIPITPLTQQALNTIDKSFKVKKAKPQTNIALTEEMDRWMEKVKVWFSPDVQYDTGPRYFRVVQGSTIVCLVDRQDGTIHKASYAQAAPNSTRGTIFDSRNVFNQHGLIYKDAYNRLLHESTKTMKDEPTELLDMSEVE